MELPGVAEASDRARDALGRAHRHRANLRGWPVTAAEAALRAARASSVLDGGPVRLETADRPDRLGRQRSGLRWSAAGGPGAGRRRRHSGRGVAASARCRRWRACTCWPPRTRSTRIGWVVLAPSRGRTASGVARRARDGGTRASAPVVAAVAHGELLTLKPFGSADGVVARAVSRLVTIATGLDPHGLGVPEVRWMRQSADYRDAARGFAEGTPEGVGAWLVLCCRALQAGAQEALTIAESLSTNPKRCRPMHRKRSRNASGRRSELLRSAAR